MVSVTSRAQFTFEYFADGRQMMSPFAFSRSATNMVWQDMHSSKLPQTKDFLPKPAKGFDKVPSIVSMFSDDNSGLLTSRSIAAKTIVPGCCCCWPLNMECWVKRWLLLLSVDRIVVIAGLEDPNSISSCDPNGAQDVNRALSLLSSNSWGPYETKFLSLERSSRTSGINQSMTHSMTHQQQRLPLASSSEYWHTDHQQQPSPSTMSMCISFSDCDANNRFQDFQLLSAPYDSPFPCNHLEWSMQCSPSNAYIFNIPACFLSLFCVLFLMEIKRTDCSLCTFTPFSEFCWKLSIHFILYQTAPI